MLENFILIFRALCCGTALMRHLTILYFTVAYNIFQKLKMSVIICSFLKKNILSEYLYLRKQQIIQLLYSDILITFKQ